MAKFQEEHMRIIHWFVGSLILFFDWLTSPKGIKRASHIQASVNAKAKDLTLYQYKACPFCVKVRRSMKRQSLPIETRDAKRCETAKEELLAGGGALKVPCLRVVNTDGNVHWMYESKEIIAYLEAQFAEAA